MESNPFLILWSNKDIDIKNDKSDNIRICVHLFNGGRGNNIKTSSILLYNWGRKSKKGRKVVGKNIKLDETLERYASLRQGPGS